MNNFWLPVFLPRFNNICMRSSVSKSIFSLDFRFCLTSSRNHLSARLDTSLEMKKTEIVNETKHNKLIETCWTHETDIKSVTHFGTCGNRMNLITSSGDDWNTSFPTSRNSDGSSSKHFASKLNAHFTMFSVVNLTHNWKPTPVDC